VRAGLAAGLAALLVATHAEALFSPRHLVCRSEAAATAPVVRERAVSDWVALPSRRVAALALGSLVVDDVAEYEPMPSRRPAPGRPLARSIAMQESRNDFRCLGLVRGGPGILRVVSAPPGTRFFGHPYPDSWRQTNMRAAGAFALAQAVPGLRRELGRPIPESFEPWQRQAARQTQHAAARALADLGDARSAPALLALLRTLETDGFNLWRDTLAALPRLDPKLAQGYALELIGRVIETPGELRRNPRLFGDVLPLITSGAPAVLDLLRRASALVVAGELAPAGLDSCELLAARVRLGDVALRDELRPELALSVSTQRAAACYSTLMPDLYPGRDVDELDVLMHRHRYEALLAWLHARRASPRDARAAEAERRLLAWLRKRSAEPDVAGDRSDRRFHPGTRALHLVALAVLGDAPGQRALDALIADPEDDGTAPWIAALHAIEFGLSGAAERAETRLRLGIAQSTRRFSRKSWPERGSLKITEQGAVIEALAARGDARFVLGLLLRSGFDRELTATLVARRPPRRVCEIVAGAAASAGEQQVQDAYWSLSVLGDRCRSVMAEQAKNAGALPHVRGMALESLAMLRDAQVPAIAGSLERDAMPAVGRARIIQTAKE
jgi:hypothetical protein